MADPSYEPSSERSIRAVYDGFNPLLLTSFCGPGLLGTVDVVRESFKMEVSSPGDFTNFTELFLLLVMATLQA